MQHQYANPLHTDHCAEACIDHHFAGDEQAQYDALRWRGRRLYDLLRWGFGASHEQAWAPSAEIAGTKD